MSVKSSKTVDETMARVGRELKNLRVMKGWSREAMAEETCLSTATIYAAERGNAVNLRTITRMAAALGRGVGLVID